MLGSAGLGGEGDLEVFVGVAGFWWDGFPQFA